MSLRRNEPSVWPYRIADCCQEEAIPVAKLTQDHAAGVEPHADCNWLWQLVSQCSIHVGETAMNKLRFSTKAVDLRMSTNMIATKRSMSVASE
jgi:hypothetical protein